MSLLTNFKKSKTSLGSSYLIFIAAIILFTIAAMVGLTVWLTAQAATPVITGVRSASDAVSLTGVITDTNYEFKSSSDAIGKPFWTWNYVDGSANCNARGFGASGIHTADLAITNNNLEALAVLRPVYNLSQADRYICLKVFYGLRDNDNSWLTSYYTYYLDNTAPQVNWRQVGSNLEMSITDEGPANGVVWNLVDIPWRSHYMAGTNICATSTFLNAYSAGDSSSDADTSFVVGYKQAIFPLTEAMHDRAVCLRVTDSSGNIGYSSVLRTDLLNPILAANQDNAVLTVTVDNGYRSYSEIDVSSWQYRTSTISRACDATAINWRNLNTFVRATTSSTQAMVTLTSRDNNLYYCFRVADKVGNYGYIHVKIKPINAPPDIYSVRQSHGKLSASASDADYVDNSSWQYVIVTSNVCSAAITRGWSNQGLNLLFASERYSDIEIDLSHVIRPEDNKNYWICLRVADSLADNYGYKIFSIDISAPVIQVKQNNRVLGASATSGDGLLASTWEYVYHNAPFVCNAEAFGDYTQEARQNLVLSNQHLRNYFCFRVADRAGNYGYSAIYFVTTLDAISPEIELSQVNDVLLVSVASSINLDSDTWGWVRAGSANNVVCDDSYSYNRLAGDNNQIKLFETDIGHWFCVRVADNSGNYGYAQIKVTTLDATAPQVTISQYQNMLIASSQAGDLDASSWQYAVSAPNQVPNCSASNEALNFNYPNINNREVALTSDDQDRYYCFRVADRHGNYGYTLSHQIEISDLAVPVLTIVDMKDQKRLEVSTSANDVDGLTWGWVVLRTDPGNCASVTSYNLLKHQSITVNTDKIIVRDIADSQDGSYYCFRVADKAGNYGYVKYRYDLSAPDIKFDFNSRTNVLTISSSAADVDNSTWRYANFAGQPDCQSAQLIQPLTTSRQLALRPVNNNTWLCFKVADNSGNYNYAVYAITGIQDVRIPVIKVSENTQTIIAGTTSNNIDITTWRYTVYTSEPFCSGVREAASALQTRNARIVYKVNLPDNAAWVCFSLSAITGQTGYQKWQIDTTPPTLKISQNNLVLNIESSDNDLDRTSWGYFKSKHDFVCGIEGVVFNSIDTDSSRLSFNLTKADVNSYYCFTVSDQTGYVTFAKVKINQLDLQAPVVVLKQANNLLTASASNVNQNSWQYLVSKTDINCSGDNAQLIFSSPSKNNRHLTLSESHNGYWFCLRVQGNNGIYGYAKLLVSKIDSTSPIVTVAHDANKQQILASANEAIKQWRYVILATPATVCDQSAFSDNQQVQLGNQVDTSQVKGQMTYCFQALDGSDNHGYQSLVIDLTEESVEGTEIGDEQSQTESDTDQDKNEQITTADDDNLIFIIGLITASLITVAIIILLISNARQRKNDEEEEDFDSDYV